MLLIKPCTPVETARIKAMPIIPIEPAKLVRNVRPFLVIRLLKDSARVLFSLLREIFERSAVCVGDKDLLEGDKLKEYLLDLYRERTNETVYALYFASDGEFIGKQVVFHGGISSAKFSLL